MYSLCLVLPSWLASASLHLHEARVRVHGMHRRQHTSVSRWPRRNEWLHTCIPGKSAPAVIKATGIACSSSTGQLSHLLVQYKDVGRLVLAARRRSIDLTSMIAAYSNDNRSNAPYVQSDQSRMAARRLGWDSSVLSPTGYSTYCASRHSALASQQLRNRGYNCTSWEIHRSDRPPSSTATSR